MDSSLEPGINFYFQRLELEFQKHNRQSRVFSSLGYIAKFCELGFKLYRVYCLLKLE